MRIVFMGRSNGRAWWDVECFGGWLVINAGRWRGRKLRIPRAFWSPNGTPWHHGARNIFRAERHLKVSRPCVCDKCEAGPGDDTAGQEGER